MRPLTLTKVIILPESVKSISDVYIEDHFVYELDNSDLKIGGNISIDFNASTETGTLDRHEAFEVDALLSLAKIDCAKDLKLQFKDYTASIDEKIIRFMIRYELFGNGEKVVSFKEAGDEILQDKILSVLNREYGENGLDLNMDDIKNLVEKIDNPVEKIENFKVEDKVIEIPTETPIKEEKQEENKEVKEKLFKEKYVVAFFFYKVPSDDVTYEKLARDFNVDLIKLKEVNKDLPLKMGRLVKIPRE